MRSMLKVRLFEAGMSQKALAERVGVSKDTVWRWTTDEGVGSMTLRRAVEVSEVLGCDVDGQFGLFRR